jgi:hypothetical protein
MTHKMFNLGLCIIITIICLILRIIKKEQRDGWYVACAGWLIATLLQLDAVLKE